MQTWFVRLGALLLAADAQPPASLSATLSPFLSVLISCLHAFSLLSTVPVIRYQKLEI